MKKIKTLFQRNYATDRLVRDEIVEGTEWVINGEGVATEKIDGTACMISKDHKLYRRYTLKSGKNPPKDFEPATSLDPLTGKIEGWLPVGDSPQDKWYRTVDIRGHPPASHELVGPKVQANPYKLKKHHLIRHGIHTWKEEIRRDFVSLKHFFAKTKIEGIVWHRNNGDMVKLKARDFGYKYSEYSDSFIYMADKDEEQ